MSGLFDQDLSQLGPIALDFETYDPHLKELGTSAYSGKGNGFPFSLALYHPDYGGVFVHDREPLWGKAIEWLKTNIKRGGCHFIGANIKYELAWLHFLECWEQPDLKKNKWSCVVVRAALIDSNNKQRLNLEGQAELYGLPGKTMALLEKEAKRLGIPPSKKSIYNNLYKFDRNVVKEYNIHDAYLAYEVYHKQTPIIVAEDIEKVVELEEKVTPVLAIMESKGLRIDLKKLDELEAKLEAQVKELSVKANAMAGEEVSPNPSLSLERALKRHDIPLPLTPTGKLKTDRKTLEAFKDHEFIKIIMELRVVSKMLGTFVQGAIRKNLVGDRIYVTMNQLASDQGGTITGRLSCSKPNGQQIPKRDEVWGPLMRGLFIADEGFDLIAPDFCFSADTEVLTNNGWKLFSELGWEDKVAQYNPEHGITYAMPIDYQNIEYKGPMYNFTGASTDLMVTENHNCYVETQTGNPKWVKAYEYSAVERFQRQAGVWNEHGFGRENPDLLKLVAAIQADASHRKAGYRFWLGKQRKIKRLKDILKGLSIEYTEYHCDKKAAGHGIVIPHTEGVDKYLSSGKTFNRERLLYMSLEDRRMFLWELGYWDGNHKSNTAWTYSTCSRRNAETVQEMAILSGYRSSINHTILKSGKDFYVVNLCFRDRTSTKMFKETVSRYEGRVYCVTMPESTVIVRRNGKVSITGQSKQEPRLSAHFAAEWGVTGGNKIAQAFIDNPNLDPHSLVAEWAGLIELLGDKTGYGAGKTMNLGLSYGMQSKTLGVNLTALGVPDHLTRDVEQAYHSAFPHIKACSQGAARAAAKKGYIRTLSGRKYRFDLWRPVQDWKAKPYPRAQAMKIYQIEERGWALCRAGTHKAFNAVIQGSAADQTKMAMVVLYYEHDIVANLQVHDELVDCEGTPEKAEIYKDVMENVVKLRVPVKVSVTIGKSWAE